MIHSILIIGQSNMAGRGFFNEVKEINSEKLRVLRNGRWYPFYRPVCCDRPFSGVCLAESFAEAYAKKYNVEVGLIPCADGGTSLDQWQIGGLLFDNAVSQAKLAQRTSTIAGVLWHQGEADLHESLYSTYSDRFQIIMDAFRKELNLYDVPFLLGGLGEFLVNFTGNEFGKNYPYVNDQLQKIANNNSMTGFVSSEGLSPNPDNLHFNASSLHEFGLRYFNEFEKLRDPNKTFEDKPIDEIPKKPMEFL